MAIESAGLVSEDAFVQKVESLLHRHRWNFEFWKGIVCESVYECT
jgi:hypothetical protein